MIRLNVVVEGQTEETFVRDILTPELSARNVFPSARSVQTGSRGARKYRGGSLSYAQWKKDLGNWMKQEGRRREVWFTTMIDFYELPDDFPGYEECRRKPDPWQRVECLEETWLRDMNHPHFIPYIQMHEFEALLFADVTKFAGVYPSEPDRIRRLQDARRPFRTVDEIDEGDETAPSKRIREVFPSFDKVFEGTLVALDIGLARMCGESPHFKRWWERLLGLGRTTGTEQTELPPGE
jgi:hypothetical protein